MTNGGQGRTFGETIGEAFSYLRGWLTSFGRGPIALAFNPARIIKDAKSRHDQ